MQRHLFIVFYRLDWIYDADTWFPSTPSEYNSSDSSYANNVTNSQPDDCFNQLKDFLSNTHFTGEIRRTHSYSTSTLKTQANRRSEARKIIIHILKILAPDGNDVNILFQDIIDHESACCTTNK